MTRRPEPFIDVPGDEAEHTSEVGAEGGTSGDVEIVDIDEASTGSEATETLRTRPRQRVNIDRDRAGRRSP